MGKTTQPLDIVFFVPGMPFDGNTINQRSLGGSETAGYYMARAMFQRGHRVCVFSNCDADKVCDGVVYRPIGAWRNYASITKSDVTIIQRDPISIAHSVNSKVNLLWCHDLALVRSRQQFMGCMWNADKVITVSQWMSNQYKEVYGLPDSALLTSRNGIDLDAFRPFSGLKRDRFKLVYAARPERGLDNLLTRIFPKLLEKDKRFKLCIAAYDNTVPEMQQFYAELGMLASRFGDRVVRLGALNKKQLYNHYATAGAYIYPTPSPRSPSFREVSCISAMESMASGLPFVTHDMGALKETLGDAGVFASDPESMIEMVYKIATDDTEFNKYSEAGIARAANLGWDGVAEDWESKIWEILNSCNDNPLRLARHLVKHSDVVAAREVLAKAEQTEDVVNLSRTIEDNFGAIFGGHEKFREHYEKIGSGHTDVFTMSHDEPRLKHCTDWLNRNPKIQRILDFGCSHGAYPIHLSNDVGRQFVGVDHDQFSVDWCNRQKDDPAKCKRPDLLTFYRGDENIDLTEEVEKNGKFDAVFIFEVLEHVPEPWLLVDKLEKWLKPNGKVLVTVPFGPWEYMSYDSYPHRCHIWEFDLHDLFDMFQAKKDFQLYTMSHGTCEELIEHVGWSIAEYTPNGQPTNKVNLDRKLKLQRPRETVSAVLIAGPGSEDTLHWCLKSLTHVADEIVIGDCGLSEESRRIIGMYPRWLCPIKLVQASNPTTEGFETPRNQALAHAIYDWILWIDTDEKLLDGGNLLKYLRKNVYDGYSIRQHHFAVDTNFTPDMPVRCFRRVSSDGRALKWYGMIHEHPERAVNEGPGLTIVIGDCNVAHLGYLKEPQRRMKFARNYPMLEKDKQKYPDRLLQKHFIMRDNMIISGRILEQTGGNITDEVKRRCEETIEIWRKHFRGKPSYINADSLGYYSKACEVLGIGFSARYELTTDKVNAHANGGAIVARFANQDDYVEELGSKLKDLSEPYKSIYY